MGLWKWAAAPRSHNLSHHVSSCHIRPFQGHIFYHILSHLAYICHYTSWIFHGWRLFFPRRHSKLSLPGVRGWRPSRSKPRRLVCSLADTVCPNCRWRRYRWGGFVIVMCFLMWAEEQGQNPKFFVPEWIFSMDFTDKKCATVTMCCFQIRLRVTPLHRHHRLNDANPPVILTSFGMPKDEVLFTACVSIP